MTRKKNLRNDSTVVLAQNIDIQFIGSGERPNPEHSRYPNKLTMISFAMGQKSPRFDPHLAGFALLHVERTEHENGVSFGLKNEGSFGFDINHQSELSAQLTHRLRPDHVQVGLNMHESIERLGECAGLHTEQDFSALLSSLHDYQRRDSVLDIAELLRRPNFKIADAMAIVGSAVHLDLLQETFAWATECEHQLAQFCMQRNRLLWHLLVSLTLRPMEHEAALLALSMR